MVSGSHSQLRDGHYRGKIEEFVKSAGANGLAALSDAIAAASAARETPATREEVASNQLGAWKVEHQEGRILLRRNAQPTQHRFWVDAEELWLEKADFKVALLGESVARGYLLDPEYTPAEALQVSLNTGRSRSDRAVRVVDLAKTDLTLDELDAMIDRLSLIEPDAVVLFVGNNVARLPLDQSTRVALGIALEQGGMPALQSLWRDTIVPARITQSLRRLAASVSDPSSVVVVIPEFNLLGWRETEIPGLLWQSEEDTRAWFESLDLLDRTPRTPEHRDDRQRAAQRMQAADQGLCWRAHWEQGLAACNDGRNDAARRHLEAARDCRACLFVPHTPRCTSSMQAALKAGATELAFECVDLRDVLSPASNGSLPERRFFLDYCHLSAEGIGKATTSIDAAIRRRHQDLFDQSSVEESRVPAPRSIDIAASLLLAAVHNAHYGQSPDAYADYVERAFATDPSVADAAQSILHLLIDIGPTWSNRAFPALMLHPLLRRYFPGDDRAIGGKFDDSALMEMLVEKLVEESPEKRKAFGDRLQTTMCVDEEQDLTDPIAHARSFRALHNYTYCTKSAYLKAFDRRMRFRFFISDPNRRTILRLCFRAAAETADTLEISINDTWSRSVGCPRVWKSIDLDVYPQAVKPGLNYVTLTWPMVPSPRVRPQELRQILARGEEVDALAWFGEIFSFTIEQIEDEDAAPR